MHIKIIGAGLAGSECAYQLAQKGHQVELHEMRPAKMTAAHQKLTGKKAEKGEMTAAEKIKMMDTNADGVMSADEHAAGAKMMFEKMDTDHDSYLTKAEMKAGHEKFMHRKAASSGAVRPAD